MPSPTHPQKASNIVTALGRATSDELVLWKVIRSHGDSYGLYRTTFRDYEFQAEYRTGQKAFNEVSIKVAGEWLPVASETGPVLKLLSILQANELELLVLELFPNLVPESVTQNEAAR